MWYKRCVSSISVIGALAFSSQALSTPSVSGQTISWPDDGWYQVQIQGDFESDVCQGGTSCEVEPGTYLVINHSTGERFNDVVVSASPEPTVGSSETPMVMGNTISWPDNGWYQVQVQGDFASDVCQGGTSCEVEPGTYVVINLTTGERFNDIVVVGDSGGPNNLLDTLIEAGNFTILLSAFEALEITELLTDDASNLTLFPATDDAFAMLNPELAGDLELVLGNETLLGVLANHLVDGVLDSATLFSLEGENITSAFGESLPITVEDGTLFVDGARVTVADVQTSNGVIHVIDSVLVPSIVEDPVPTVGPPVGPPASPGTILDIAESAGDFSLFLGGVDVAGLSGSLGNPDDFFTVFAPTDEAIEALGQETIEASGQESIEALLSDPDAVRDLLLFHVIPGTVFRAADLAEILGFDIGAGNGGTLVVSESGEGLTVNGVNITVADIPAVNGVIHVIDAVLIP